MLQFSCNRLGEKLKKNNFFTYCNGWMDGWVGVMPVLRIILLKTVKSIILLFEKQNLTKFFYVVFFKTLKGGNKGRYS